jgi:hypothetical protein
MPQIQAIGIIVGLLVGIGFVITCIQQHKQSSINAYLCVQAGGYYIEGKCLKGLKEIEIPKLGE